MRKDAVQNRRQLIDAAEAVLGQAPQPVTMGDIAKAAGLSVATAYRFFPSLDDLLNAFLRQIVVRLRDYSHDCNSKGPQLYEDVVEEWIRLVGIHGRGMAKARSRRGYLERLRERDPVITAVRDAWERPVRAVMKQEDIPEDQFEFGLLLHNQLFDPREILDLMGHGLEPATIKARLTSAYYGALRGWSTAVTKPITARTALGPRTAVATQQSPDNNARTREHQR